MDGYGKDGKRGKGMGLGSLGLWSLWLGAGFGSLGLEAWGLGRALGLWVFGVWGLGLWAWDLGLGTLGLGTPPNKLCSLMEKENRNEKYIRESIFGFKNIDLEFSLVNCVVVCP